MIRKLTSLTLALFIIFGTLWASPKQSLSLTINLISQNLFNGLGKEADALILREQLENLGHQVQFIDFHKTVAITPADINIFLAQFKVEWLRQAKLNWFVPNAEFYDADVKELLNFDLVLCKTRESFKIFKPISKNAYYLGFTSFDHYEAGIKKDFSSYLHLAGGSRMKGSNEVKQAWMMHPELPKLILVMHQNNIKKRPYPSNIHLMPERITPEEVVHLQNQCGIHLCPSKTEGFGHYIMEGMSAGSVIITTDAPPMNEFIKDKRCLVKYRNASKQKLATTYIVDYNSLALTVKELQKLSLQDLKSIGLQNREEFLIRNEEFRKNLQKLMRNTVKSIKNSSSAAQNAPFLEEKFCL